jgi:hypothetical protein
VNTFVLTLEKMMKKLETAGLIALLAVCAATMSQSALAASAMSTGSPKVVAAEGAEKEDSPPTYVLVLAGLSVVLFVTRRRRR